LLKSEANGNLIILTIDRPEQRNALNVALFKNITQVLDTIRSDDSVAGLIITGEGDKAFCAGIDLKERAGKEQQDILLERDNYIRPFYNALANFPKPTFAALNGVVLGGGAELALACDFRIACFGATFGQTEIKWGMIPSCGACQRLRLLTGMGVAKDLIMSGRLIDAQEAHRIGIYNRLVDIENLKDETLEIANQICSNPAVAVKTAKKVLDQGANVGLSLEYEYAASMECFVRGDALRGPKRF